MKTKSFLSLLNKSRISSVILFSLALMLLVFSCPLKRLLTLPATHTSAIRTNQTNQPEKNNPDQDNGINSCSVKKDGQLVKLTVSKEIKSFPRVLSNHNFHYGSFSNPYYLTATIGRFKTGNSVFFSLPLFLRHSSLLI